MTNYTHLQFVQDASLTLQDEIDAIWRAESHFLRRNSPLAYTNGTDWPWTLADITEENYGL